MVKYMHMSTLQHHQTTNLKFLFHKINYSDIFIQKIESAKICLPEKMDFKFTYHLGLTTLATKSSNCIRVKYGRRPPKTICTVKQP